MNGQRRLRQTIPDGHGMPLILRAAGADTASMAERRGPERSGAEGVVLDGNLPGVRNATGLPILWRRESSPAEALDAGADALLVTARSLEDDSEFVERRWQEAHDIGLECVVEVADADELE